MEISTSIIFFPQLKIASQKKKKKLKNLRDGFAKGPCARPRLIFERRARGTSDDGPQVMVAGDLLGGKLNK